MNKFFGAAVAALLAAGAADAATTVSFTLLDGATQVAQGSFTYDDSKTGVLGYSDLDDFSYQIGGGTVYDLAFVNSGGFSDYYYLGYDTGAGVFVEATIDGFPEFLTAIKGDFASGFFTRQDDFTLTRDYAASQVDFTTIEYSTSTSDVPEPASWAMMAGGFGLLGAALRRRKAGVSFA